MPERDNPATARRRLHRQLRSLREKAMLSSNEVAHRFHWHVSKLIRIENGTVAVSVPDVMALCMLYGVSDQTRDELIDLAVVAKRPCWRDEFRQMLPPHVRQFMGFEADATRIQRFEPLVIPALLQSERYAQQLGPLTLESQEKSQTDELVAIRLKQQQHVLFSDTPPEYIAVLEESVLRRQVGGPDVMTEQFAHLAQLVSDGIIGLGILPFTHSAYVGLAAGFQIMQFGDSHEETLLFLESAHGIALQDKPELIALYGEWFEQMVKVSHFGHDAVRFIRELQANQTT